ncbi:MAG TPA: hypothetical protein ENJ82_05020 [Bacteroidetes bacterium]|nr:hypothetical protein [Bacteroidota bacterium]
MRLKVCFYFSCLILFLGSCNKTAPTKKTCPDFPLATANVLQSDERALFDLVLNTYYTGISWRMAQLAGKEITLDLASGIIRESGANVATEIIENYVLNNHIPTQLPDEFRFPLITYAEMDCIYSIDPELAFWDNFHTKYPNYDGFISFTRPGLNINRTKAVLIYGVGFGTLNEGAEYIVNFEKINGVWTILQRFDSPMIN